jgi:cell pole-organizing protein PopZ
MSLGKETEAMSAAHLIQTTGDLADVARGASNEGSREVAREPSMEDILASIRRIIAQDQSLFAAAATGETVELVRAPGVGDPGEAPVYELRREVEAGTFAIDPEAIPAGGEAPGQPEANRGEGGEPLVSPATDGSVATAFNTLVASRFAQDPDAILAMTRDALRPLVASWLDANLPALVEGLVRAEIERIAKGA